MWFGTKSRMIFRPRRWASATSRSKSAERAEQRIDVAIVGDVVAEVRHRRGIDRRNPDRVDAQPDADNRAAGGCRRGRRCRRRSNPETSAGRSDRRRPASTRPLPPRSRSLSVIERDHDVGTRLAIPNARHSKRLRQAGLAQDSVGGMTTENADRHREISLRDRAMPDFMAAAALPDQTTTSGAQQIPQRPVELRRHVRRRQARLRATR